LTRWKSSNIFPAAAIWISQSADPNEAGRRSGRNKEGDITGRGGAGFATATKWGFVRSAISDENTSSATAMKATGAYMNRANLRQSHAILEGMAIGLMHRQRETGLCLYPGRIPVSNRKLAHALKEAEARGLLVRIYWEQV